MTRISLEDADTVAVAGSPVARASRSSSDWPGGSRARASTCSWRPTIGDVAGPRVTMRMAADLPLLHLDEPYLTGPKRAIKRTLDIVFGVLLFVLFLPFMIVGVIGTKLSSRGPAFYFQDRVGRGGQIIKVAKIRTMHVGADQQRDDVIGAPDEAITRPLPAGSPHHRRSGGSCAAGRSTRCPRSSPSSPDRCPSWARGRCSSTRCRSWATPTTAAT